MNFNRRDLLKIFGVGAVVAPVFNGLTDESTRARIIEPGKLELVEAPKLIDSTDPFWMHKGATEFDAVIYLTSKTSPVFTVRWDVTVKAIDMEPLSIRDGKMLFTIRGKDGKRWDGTKREGRGIYEGWK